MLNLQQARVDSDQYLNPASSGRGDRHSRYSDDYDRDYDRPSRGRDDRSGSRHRKHKSRNASPEFHNPMHNAMHKHLDGTEKGMTSGAIGKSPHDQPASENRRVTVSELQRARRGIVGLIDVLV